MALTLRTPTGEEHVVPTTMAGGAPLGIDTIIEEVRTILRNGGYGTVHLTGDGGVVITPQNFPTTGVITAQPHVAPGA